MRAIGEPREHEKNEYHRQDLGTRLTPFLKNTLTVLEELKSRIAELPKVDKDGHSECPFALQLYQKKEEAEKTVALRLQLLREYLKAVEKELERCKGNLQEVIDEEAELETEAPRKDFAEAKRILKGKCKYVEEQRQAILKLMDMLEKGLEKSRAVKYPAPRESAEDVLNKPLASASEPPESSENPLGSPTDGGDRKQASELDDLISLGLLDSQD